MQSPALSPVIALLYADGRRMDPLMASVAARLEAAGVRLAGFVQHERHRPGRSRCDMILEDLSGRGCVEISEDRGPHARGCRLDQGALIGAMQGAREAIAEGGADLLILNKFGKSECEGGGFRPLFVDAVERGIPVVIAVPLRNLDAWRAFAGDLAVEIDIDTEAASPSALFRRVLSAALDRDTPSSLSAEVMPS